MISVSQLRRLAIQNPQKLEQEAISLRKRLWEMERDYNRLYARLESKADVQRIIDWMGTSLPPEIAFIQGPERDLARAIRDVRTT